MPVAEIELFVFLLFAVAVLAGLGLRSGVPYPVALVLGGLVIGLVPGLPSPELDPDVVFFVFLPPLLYAAAARARRRRSQSSSSPSPRAASRSGSPRAGSSPTCAGSSPTRRWTSRSR